MTRVINSKLASYLILGSSIYSTGGGITLEEQEKSFSRLIRQGRKLELVSIEELRGKGYICTAYLVGSAVNAYSDSSKLLRVGLQTLEKYTGKKFSGIFFGEVNIEAVAFQAAVSLDLPVVDGDCTGGRAVPEIMFDNFVLKKQKICPLVAVNPRRKISILLNETGKESMDTFVRKTASVFPSQDIIVCDHAISARKAKKVLTLNTISRSIDLGKYIMENINDNNLLQNVIKKLGGQLLFKGKISKVALKETRREGFLEGFYYIRNQEEDECKVYVRNENLICWINNKVLLTPPDCILTIDTSTFVGVHNSQIKKGQNVMVVGKRATDLWRTKEGITLFNPKKFGFNIKNKLL